MSGRPQLGITSDEYLPDMACPRVCVVHIACQARSRRSCGRSEGQVRDEPHHRRSEGVGGPVDDGKVISPDPRHLIIFLRASLESVHAAHTVYPGGGYIPKVRPGFEVPGRVLMRRTAP